MEEDKLDFKEFKKTIKQYKAREEEKVILNINVVLDLINKIDEQQETLENLLTRYKQLEEENKKLIAQKTAINNKRKELEEELEGFRTGKYISLKVNELYIPKSKIKEKIEELKKDLERDRICIDFVIEHTKDIELMAEIKVLQELLEEE